MTDEQKRLPQQDPLDVIREHELAWRWQKSIRTLQRWRADGYGPAFINIGGSVYYRVGDILAFETRMRHGGEADQ